jgi:hypothetical protein
MPYFAVLTTPLTGFTFSTALFLWRLIQAASLAIGIVLWPGSKWTLAFVTLISIPAILGISLAQDVGLVFAFAIAAIALERRGWSFLGGLIFSLCLTKPHLVIFVPLVMVARKNIRFLTGAALGAGAQILLSYMVASPDWPAQWFSILASPQMHPYPHGMLGLRALMEYRCGPLLVAWVVLVLAAILWRMAGDRFIERPFAVALAAGVIANLHSYPHDCILLLPATALAIQARPRSLRFIGWLLASPLLYIECFRGDPLPFQIAVVVLIFLNAYSFRDQRCVAA